MSRMISHFVPNLAALLPETHDLLSQANLTVHDAVSQITLLGSRGVAGTPRPTSDIELSIMVDVNQIPPRDPERGLILREVIETTLNAWHSHLDVDLAAVFDLGTCCGMQCFNQRVWNDRVIQGRGVDCFGIYKTQRGFDGYVTEGVRLDAMYPLLVIWRRD